ncbi:BtpA/SgcQ family protein [Halobellus salinisoli]|uniref:BtpA/SgcQ family protein n=1 Tax=Halobellus salinisoli TaxID=3108500 RepID=UPI0031F30063
MVILADIDVKQSAPLTERSHAEVVSELVERGRADAVVVSGAGTGEAVDTTVLERVGDTHARRQQYS